MSERRAYPCTSAQKRFWVLSQLEPGNPALNIAVRWQLDGEVPQPLLDRVWQRLFDRHEPLRTFFVETAGELRQIVEPRIAVNVRSVDLTARTPAEAEEEAERIAATEARRSFNLSLAPLLRVTRVILTPRRSIVLVTAHHIICDGWSVGLLADQMGRLLADPSPDVPGPDLSGPNVPNAGVLAPDALGGDVIQYGEYAAWQQATLDAEAQAASTAYWRETLQGIRQFELPTDHPRPRLQSSNGRIVSTVLDRKLTDRLATLARQSGCSLFAASLGALMVLLHRLSQETDVSLGTQLAGRDSVDLEQVIGVFINTVVLRADLGGDPSFRAFLTDVGGRVRDALAHAAAPFEDVLEALRLPRDTARNPIFSINFIFQRSFVRNADYGAIHLTDLPSTSAGSMYDLNVFMVERPDGWRFSCEYNTDLFEADTVVRLLERYAIVLDAATAAPDSRISALAVMSEAERRWLLADCNDTAAAPPPQPNVVALFKAQAAASPDAPAVTCNATALSYGALAAMADRIAAALVSRNIGAGDRVGVLLERSAALPAALLGVMASGAAYVPLDPAYPRARLMEIVEDSDLVALITTGPVHARLDLSVDTRILLENLPDPAPADPPATIERGAGSADSLAYVIYTSGSTGRPKGVEVGHHALANLLWSMRERPGLAAADTLLAVTTISFDIAALELLLPLVVGARAIIADDTQVTDGVALAGLMRRHRVTVMQATPVTWRLMLESGWKPVPALRMLCGGEALPRDLALTLIAGGGELWNLYGPTETTIWSSALRVTPGAGPVPIGQPIANTQLYVMDRHAQLVPTGALGELFIGGAGVAFGYRNQPALTADRFLPDPFTPGARVYRTGDVVRRRTDGTLDFLGRVDHQVKLRGFRVELGAIEAVLLQCPGIADAVVVAGRPEPTAELELWAYVTVHDPAPGAGIAAVARQFVSEHLPAYMVPQRLTVLQALPRTPNGKVDRRALPAPNPEQRAANPALLDDVEAKLAAIWCRVLGIAAAEPSFDFFELGGNSLTAMRMLSEVNTTFDRTLRPAILFRHPTLEQLAELLRRPGNWDFDFSEVVQLQAEGSRPTLIALNNTGVFFRLARRLGSAQPFIALQLFDPMLRRQNVSEDFTAIALEYVQLIQQAQPSGPYALIGWCVAGSLAFEVAQQLRRTGQEVRLVVIIDAWAPGYGLRHGRLRSSLTELSLKVQTIARDAVRVVRGDLSLGAFVLRRRALRRLLGRSQHDGATEDELYHDWILSKLNAAASRYSPPDYDGHVLLLRADQEPRGPFIDRRLGWAGHVTGRLTTANVHGDHTSIFADPGVQQMADYITAAMDAA